MGYTYQFITLAGIHNMWYNMFDLAHSYAQGEGMSIILKKYNNKSLMRKVEVILFSAPTGGWDRLF